MLSPKLKGKLRDDIWQVMEEAEEKLTDLEIIELRKFIIYNFLEGFCDWKEKGDCLPEYVKVGCVSNDYIEIKYHQ